MCRRTSSAFPSRWPPVPNKKILARGQGALYTRVNPAGIALENRVALLRPEGRQAVDVPARVVVVMAGLRVDAAHGAHHLRREDDVLVRDDLGQQPDPGRVVNASVEVDVVKEQLVQGADAEVLRDAAIAAPVVGNGAAAVRNDEQERREALKEL